MTGRSLPQNAADEIKAIEALGSVLEPGKLLVVTSGIGITAGAPGQVRKETDPPADSPGFRAGRSRPRRQWRRRVCMWRIVRLPQVHDTRKQGLVTCLIQIARDKGVSAYVGDGANRWAAAPLKDVAHLYRLAVEKTGPGVTHVSRRAGRRRFAAGYRGDNRQGAEGTGQIHHARAGR